MPNIFDLKYARDKNSPNKFEHSKRILNRKPKKTKNFQAESRIQILEKAVSEAQTSESQVSELQQWIFRVDELLNDYIEHDTTFECLPHDFQVILLFECLTLLLDICTIDTFANKINKKTHTQTHMIALRWS